MNFLSNLWSGVKNVASTVYDAFAGTARDSMAANALAAQNPQPLPSSLKGPLGSLKETAKSLVTGNTSILKPSNYITPQPTNPDNSGLKGPFASLKETFTTPTPSVRPSTAKYAPQMSQAPAGTGYMTPAPSNTGISTASGNVATAPSAFPSYQAPVRQAEFDSAGRQIPVSGAAGTSGTGYSGTAGFTPISGTTGTSGFSGGSSFNGMTSGVGTFGSSPITQTTDSAEQQKKNKYQAQQSQMPQEVPAWLQQINNVLGTGMSEQPFSAPSAPTTNNVGDILASRGKTGPVVSSTVGSRTSDIGTTNAEIGSKIQQNLGKQEPTPTEPVVPTKEQEDFLNNGNPQERLNIQSAMDQFRQSIGLTELQNARLETQKAISAINTTYQSFYDDIKANPNLPKGLAQRRLATLEKDHKAKLDQLTSQLQIQGQQIEDANNAVNQQFGILKETQAEDERRRTYNLNLLKMYTDSGAIGQFADEDIAKWSQATGIPAEQLRAIKTAASQPDTKIVEGNDGAFYKQTIGKDGKVSVTRVTDPIVSPSKTGTELTPTQNSNLLSITTKYQNDSIIKQVVEGQTANAIADQVIANPGSATNQLKSLYLLVKNLDPGSAVREGELALANQTQSYLQRFETSLTRIGKGQVINASAAKELAQATKDLVGTWTDTAKTRTAQYASQAQVLGVGEPFSSYIGGSTVQPSQNNTQQDLTQLPDGSEVNYDGKTYYKYGNELRGIEELFSPMK